MDRLDPQLIIFLVFIVISGLSRLFSMMKNSRRAETASSEPAAEPAPQRGGREESFPEPYEELDPMRDFRRMMERAREEARQEAQARKEVLASPPPLPQVPRSISGPVASSAGVPRPAELPTPSKPRPRPSQPKGGKGGSLPAFEHFDLRAPLKGTSRPAIAALLRTPKAARNAILLTEILGKPKGMQ